MTCFKAICCGGTKEDTIQNRIVDIERHIVEFAWNNIIESTWLDRLLRSQRYDLELNYAYLEMEHNIKHFVPTGRSKKSKAESKVKRRELCLFKTQFSNTSSIEQQFTFKTERKTTSTAEVKIQKGFQINGKLNVSFKVPMDVCSITGGLGGQLNITDIKGQKFEESLTWSIDTLIKVKNNTKCLATLLVQEEEVTADFVTESIITCKCDVIPVHVIDKKTRAVRYHYLDALMLHTILEPYGFECCELGVTSQVKCQTKGTYKAVYGAEQYIVVSHEDLDPSNASTVQVTSQDASAQSSQSGDRQLQDETIVEANILSTPTPPVVVFPEEDDDVHVTLPLVPKVTPH